MDLQSWTRRQLDPVAPSLGYGCCLEDLHFGVMYNVVGGYKSRPPSQIFPSPETFVKSKETSIGLSSSITCDPQFRVKMSSQRSQPHHMQQAYRVCGYGSYRFTEPIDPTRIGIDRLSRKEISQSRTMPRSSRVWRESDP